MHFVTFVSNRICDEAMLTQTVSATLHCSRDSLSHTAGPQQHKDFYKHHSDLGLFLNSDFYIIVGSSDACFYHVYHHSTLRPILQVQTILKVNASESFHN